MKVTLVPQVLRWARERANLSVRQLAEKIGAKPEQVREWEQTGQLSFARAEKLARVTHTPFGYLYLQAPPEETLPIPDFRTVAGKDLVRPSPDLLDVLSEALRRQDWFRDYLITYGEEALSFVGSVKLEDSPDEVAARIRHAILLDSEDRSSARTWEEALRLQVEGIEESGVLVMRSGIVGNNTHRQLSVEEFRGFALSDPYAPLVFINSRDSKGAQMFTLAHELVHIWLGVSGVSNLEATYAPNHRIERYCNRVAAEVLVPAAELRAEWQAARSQSRLLAGLAHRFKVSSLVLLRRLRDLRFISQPQFERQYADEEKRFQERTAQSAGGGDFYLTQRTRTGARFAKALIESVLEGRTTYRDAFQLLGIRKIETFNEFVKEMNFAV
jgi:Zn-dependent peptidase ImmA (M78 family)